MNLYKFWRKKYGKELKKSVKKGMIIGISSVAVLMAAVYAGVGYYFHDHFYPGTVINETNFSLGTADAAEEKIKEDAEDYLLAIHDREDRVTYTAVKILIITMSLMAAFRK